MQTFPVRVSVDFEGRTIEVFGKVHPGRAAYTSGLPENCYPGEPDEFEPVRAYDPEVGADVPLTNDLCALADEAFREAPDAFLPDEDDDSGDDEREPSDAEFDEAAERYFAPCYEPKF